MAEPQPVAVERLKKRREFLAVAASGKKAIASTLIIQALQRTADISVAEVMPFIRLGFTVTKKVGNSVVRNRARRRLREAARSLIAEHGVAGWDYVVIARASAPKAPYEILLRDMKYALRKVLKQVET